MRQANWKFAAGGIVAIIVLVLLVQRLSRAVGPYHPPQSREIAPWGSLDAQRGRQLQAVLDEEVNSLKVPGLQAFVRASDGATWSGTSGTIDLGRTTELTREHVLRVGSTTKTFTAVLILRLAEQGSLGLDDPLAKWLPDFPNGDAITIRQLLNHSSGIADVLETEVLMKSIMPWTRWEPKELVEIAAKAPPHFAPGKGWWYSNTNYILLGMIAEQATGQTAADLVRGRILDPLGLTHTFFVPYEPEPALLVAGFDRDLSHFPGMLDIGWKDTSWPTAAFTSGALASTADDLGVFYQRLFAGELLSPASMSEMTTFIPAPNPGFEAQTGYGLGLMRLEVDGQELIGHVGEFMGSTAIAMSAPESGDLLVVTCNLSYPDLLAVVSSLQAAIR